MKTALIHDHLAQDGGAEKVLEIFSKMFLDAPIYTLLYDKKNIKSKYPNRRIDASIIVIHRPDIYGAIPISI
jgi:hypothetical protein